MRAIERAADTFPACRAKLAGRWGFKRWVANGPLPPVRTLFQEWDGHSQEQSAFIDTPFDLVNGPVAEIVQVLGSKSWLVFRFHHAVTDGMGMVEFIKTVFDHINQQTPRSFIGTQTVEDLPGGNLAALPPKVTQVVYPFPNTSRHDDYAGASRVWARIAIDQKDERILLKTLLGLHQVIRPHSPGTVRFQVPVNLRRHLEDDATSSNMVGMVRLDIEEQDKLRTLVRKFRDRLNQNQELPIAVRSLTSRFMFWIPLNLMRVLGDVALKQTLTRKAFRSSGTISTLGNVDLKQVSAPGFVAESLFGIPPPPLGTPIMAVIISSCHRTEVVLSANCNLADQNQLDSLAMNLQKAITDIR